MPSSYQAPQRKTETKTTSQSVNTNLASADATVQKLLDSKGGEVFSIRQQDTLGTAVQTLAEKRIGALVISDANGALIGILSERDIVRKLAETPGQTLPQQVQDVMTKDVQTCTASESLVTVLRRMTEGRFRHLPVVDDQGRLTGMVTIGDVVNFRLNALEHEALQMKQLIVG
jgi:CBS domain-containing protein